MDICKDSISPIIRGMQIKTTVRIVVTLVRAAIIQKSSAVEDVKKMKALVRNVNCHSCYGKQQGDSSKH